MGQYATMCNEVIRKLLILLQHETARNKVRVSLWAPFTLTNQ